jgi:hypothetical protein
MHMHKIYTQQLAPSPAKCDVIRGILDVQAFEEAAKNKYTGFEEIARMFTLIVNLAEFILKENTVKKYHPNEIDQWTYLQRNMKDAACDYARVRVFCDSLGFVLYMIRSTSAQILNEEIQRVKSVVVEHGITFERHCFVKAVVNGMTKTLKTQSCIRGTIYNLVFGDYTDTVPIDLRYLRQYNEEAYGFVCVSAIIDVTICTQEDMMICDLPETLHLDFLRLRILRIMFNLHVLSAVVLEGVRDGIITCNLAVWNQEPLYCLDSIEAATADAVKGVYYGNVSFDSRSEVLNEVSNVLKANLSPEHYEYVEGVLNETSRSDRCKYKEMVSSLGFLTSSRTNDRLGVQFVPVMGLYG